MIAIVAILTLLLLTTLYLKKIYRYWTTKGVYQFEPTWLLGNMTPIVLSTKNFGGHFENFYNETKAKGLKFAGLYLFTKPLFLPVDPDLIKRIMVTDFQHFNSHAATVDEGNDPLSGHLFNLEGPKWKSLRAKLTPTFTSGKMKIMFHMIVNCTGGLEGLLEEHSKNNRVANIKDVLQRFTIDIIGSCAFGIECDSINNLNSEYRVYAKKVVDDLRGLQFRSIAQGFLPKFVCSVFGIRQTNSDIERFFLNMVKDTVKYREENNVVRKDFVQMLLQLKNRGVITDDNDFKANGKNVSGFSLNIGEMAAQTFVFFIAGFETSSTLMTHALLELSLNPEIQDKVRKDIKEVLERYNGKVTYDAIKEMTYLDKAVNETLRKHPPITVIPRACVKDYKIPDTNVVIEKGTMVQISSLGIHNDPDFYPDPEKFDPERFSDENKATRPSLAFIPFGEGPRICIGLRFGVLQSKVGLISILRDYKVTINEKTKQPIELDPNLYLLKGIKGGLWLNVERLKKM